MSSLGRLAGRIALVTGAGGPMGLAVAKRFVEEGAKVVITDISQGRLDEGARQLRALCANPDDVVSLRADVAVRADVESLVKAGLESFDRIDILANIVGGYRGKDYQGPVPLTQMTEARWDSTMGLNLKPNLHLVQLLAPAMTEQRYGKIVNISSVNMAGEAGSADYGAAKAAVASLTRTLALELGPHINVNCIAPGVIRTRVIALIGQDVADEYLKRTILKRIGEPEDIANAALFLVSDEAGYITGEMLPVAGGIWPSL
jgi:3-oxoacyl-[acyl-carrier protein] reductase